MNSSNGDTLKTCRRCSCKLSVIKTCVSCGFDNSLPLKEHEVIIPIGELRSKRFTLVIYLSLIYNLLGLVLTLLFMLSHDLNLALSVLLLISVMLRALETVLAVYVIRLEKWARSIFIITTIISGLLKLYLQRLELWVALVFLFFLYLAFSKDWKKFR